MALNMGGTDRESFRETDENAKETEEKREHLHHWNMLTNIAVDRNDCIVVGHHIENECARPGISLLLKIMEVLSQTSPWFWHQC